MSDHPHVTPPRKARPGRIIAIMTGSLLLAGAAGAVALAATQPARATSTAQKYLTAVSEGRADDALNLIDPESIADASLLTDEVLADSLSRAPLTNIVAGEAIDDGHGYLIVPVSYTLGSTPVVHELQVSRSLGVQKITGATGTISFDNSLELTVNGAEPATTSPDAFPGSYVLQPDHKYLTFDEGPLLVTKANANKGYTNLDLAVTEEGIAMFREKVITEAQACLDSTALDPGCGEVMALRDDSDGKFSFREGTVTRTQDADARAQLESITPQPDYFKPTVLWASGYSMGIFEVAVECRFDGDSNWGPCYLRSGNQALRT